MDEGPLKERLTAQAIKIVAEMVCMRDALAMRRAEICGSYRLVCCRDVVKQGGEALQARRAITIMY